VTLRLVDDPLQTLEDLVLTESLLSLFERATHIDRGHSVQGELGARHVSARHFGAKQEDHRVVELGVLVGLSHEYLDFRRQLQLAGRLVRAAREERRSTAGRARVRGCGIRHHLTVNAPRETELANSRVSCLEPSSVLEGLLRRDSAIAPRKGGGVDRRKRAAEDAKHPNDADSDRVHARSLASVVTQGGGEGSRGQAARLTRLPPSWEKNASKMNGGIPGRTDDVSYAGPERRKRGLVECDTCHRRLRNTEFTATRDHERLLVSGLEPSCDECTDARTQAVARERAQFAARLRASEAARAAVEAERRDAPAPIELHLHFDPGAIQSTTHIDKGAVQVKVDAGTADMDVLRDSDGDVIGVRKVEEVIKP
jgi:hypothetical protein